MPPLSDRPPRKPLPVSTLLAGAVVLSTAIGLVVMVDGGADAPTTAAADAPVTRLSPALEETPPTPRPPPAALPAELAPQPAAPADPHTRHDGVLERGQTLGAALDLYGVPAGDVHRIVAALKGIYDFRQARPGAGFTVVLDGAKLVSFRFEHGPLDVFEVTRGEDDALVGQRVDVPVDIVEAEVGAEIRSSLYRAMQRSGESPALVAAITDVFAWDIDFYKNTHPGDRFRVIVEKVNKDGEFIRYGRILAAEYVGEVGAFRTFWFAPDGAGDDAEGHYYLEDGRSAEKTFLATPLKFARVSSGFDRARKHPVLGYTKAHLGVDYAAPTGTPVWAMAAGTVTWAGWKGPNGKLVRIDHGNGLESAYAHLHRIPRGIKKGVRVRQKQVIGYVGSTGRSTGPHLHFAVKRNGRHIDPSRLKITRGKPVADGQRAAFDALVNRRLDRLRSIPVADAVDEAPE